MNAMKYYLFFQVNTMLDMKSIEKLFTEDSLDAKL